MLTLPNYQIQYRLRNQILYRFHSHQRLRVSFCIGAHLKADAKGHLSREEAQTFLLQRKRKPSVDVREITVEQFTSPKTYLK